MTEKGREVCGNKREETRKGKREGDNYLNSSVRILPSCTCEPLPRCEQRVLGMEDRRADCSGGLRYNVPVNTSIS